MAKRAPVAALLAPLLLTAPLSLAVQPQDDGALLAYIARVRDTTRDNLIDVDDAGVLFIVPAGGDPLALTDPRSDVMAPAWSPDGRRIAFHAYSTDTDRDRTITRNDNASLFVIDLDCPGPLAECQVEPARLTDGAADDRFPAWSPDGSRIAFAARDGGGAAIALIDADCAASEAGCARSRRALVRGEGLYLDPAWSPDGSAVAFLAVTDSRPDGALSRLEDFAALYLVEVETGALRELAPADSPKAGLAWSPDGAWLAYTAITDTDGDGFVDYLYDHARVFIQGVDAPGAPVPVTGPDADASDPAWSPDGSRIVYSALTDTNGDGWLDVYSDSPRLFVVDVARGVGGVNPRALTPVETLAYAPAWSPDGASIAYVGLPARAGGGVGTAVNRFGGIFVIEAACAGACPARRLSSEETDAFAPVWSPG